MTVPVIAPSLCKLFVAKLKVADTVLVGNVTPPCTLFRAALDRIRKQTFKPIADHELD